MKSTVPDGEVEPLTVAFSVTLPPLVLLPASDVVVTTCSLTVKLLVAVWVGAPQTPLCSGVASCSKPAASIRSRASVEHSAPSEPKAAWMTGFETSVPRTTL